MLTLSQRPCGSRLPSLVLRRSRLVTFAMDPVPLRKLASNIAYARRCSKKEGLVEIALMLSQVLHAVREEVQHREDSMTTQVEACTQTLETGTTQVEACTQALEIGTQTETIHFGDDMDYTSCCSEDGELHGDVVVSEAEETQFLNRDGVMQDEGLDDQSRATQLLAQPVGSSCEQNWPMSDQQWDFFCQKIQDLSEPLSVATMDELLVVFRGKLHALRGLKLEAASESEASVLDYQQSKCKALMALLLNRRKDCTGAVT